MKILICSDGFEQAERAIRVGASIAAGCGAAVTLLGIVESPGQSPAILDSLRRTQELLAVRNVRAELVTVVGEPLPEIIRYVREHDYDLVVIGAAHKQKRGRFWLSSKSYEIIKTIKPPVLTVAGNLSGITNVLICIGGGWYNEAAVRVTSQIASAVGARVTLLHVMAEPPGIYAGLARMEETEAAVLGSNSGLGLNLRKEKQALEALGVATQLRLRRGPVLEEILNEIRAGSYDLVVTGSALSRSLRTYVLGDISREIVNRARCAVLVVRSQPLPSEGGLRFRDWWSRLGAK